MTHVTLHRARTRQHDLVEWLTKRSGVAHSSDARAAGFTGRDMAGAVDAGLVERVRRSWLVTSDCDPRRRAAATVSGRVTCVSAAVLRGLWIPPAVETDTVHVAVASTTARIRADQLRLHWGSGPAPVGRNQNEDPILNVMFHVAHCLTTGDALTIWESAIRSKIVHAEVVERVSWRSTQAAALAAVASSLSDSGLETRFVDGMRRAGVAVRQQVWIDGRPVDGLIGTSLVTQIDGFDHHSSAADRRRDLEADARLVARGYVVLRFDYFHVLFHWDYVVETVLTAIAQGAHRRRAS